jgi:hypothetical protein
MPARGLHAIGVVAVCVAALAAADSRPVFGVGVLRRDGIVIPFAAYNGKRWETSWPFPKLDLIVPVGVRAVPSGWWGPTSPLQTWEAWTTGRSAPQPVEVTQLDWVDAHCLRQVGLRTTYRSEKAVPPPAEQPYPKDGLVVSPPQAVETIELLSPSAPEVRAFQIQLDEAFNKAERLVENQYGHPIKQRAREGVSPEVEAVYSYGREPRVYYVEATRKYKKLGRTDCEAMAFGTGWFARDRGTTRSLSTVVDLLRCDREGASYMLPLGVMRLGGKLFWLAQFSGWNSERYVVVEIGQKAIEAKINVLGGGC